jgi:hypothetical protein
MKRLFLSLLLLFSLAAGGTAQAAVKIISVAISPRILMEAYRLYENHGTHLAWPTDQILMLTIQSDTAVENFTFQVEIHGGNDLVASLSPLLIQHLAKGMHSYSADQIIANNLTVRFNTHYLSNDIGKVATGSISPMRTFRLLLVPLQPQGEAYTAGLSLFTPQSALNSPPVPIYPRDVEVNTVLPAFSWTPVQKAKHYEVSVGPDQNPEVNTYWRSERIAQNQVLYSPAARALQQGGKYFWQVKALDEFGNSIGGVDGKSQAVWFVVNSNTQVNSTVSPAEVDALLRQLVANQVDFSQFNAYTPAAVESSSPDLAGLLRQLREGAANVTQVQVE